MTSKTTIRALIGAVLAVGALGASAQTRVGDAVYQHDLRLDDRYDNRYDNHYDDRHHGRTATPQIDRVMAEQAQRIQWGLRSGALTHFEARHLRRQQFQIERTKQRAVQDGRVTGGERRELRELQARAEHDIERALRNARYGDRRDRHDWRG